MSLRRRRSVFEFFEEVLLFALPIVPSTISVIEHVRFEGECIRIVDARTVLVLSAPLCWLYLASTRTVLVAAPSRVVSHEAEGRVVLIYVPVRYTDVEVIR